MVKIIDNTYSIGDTFVDTDDGDEYMLVETDDDEVVIAVTSGDYTGQRLGDKWKVDDIHNITYDELDDMSDCNAGSMKLIGGTGFKPVSFVIETEDELKELWMRYLLTASHVNKGIFIDYGYTVEENDTWDKINVKCNELGLKNDTNGFKEE